MVGYWGNVNDILEEDSQIQIATVKLEDAREITVINYLAIHPACRMGDRVYVNTVAIDLDLGTGGYGFVMAISTISEEKSESSHPGHIIKMRYAPTQVAVHAVEAPESDRHDAFCLPFSLENKRVFMSELHSVLPLWVALLETLTSETNSFKKAGAGQNSENSQGRTFVYIMDDQACLQASFSQHIRTLKHKANMMTITYGQASGGDIEAVNLYTALEAAVKVAEADDILITQGPGVVGTGTSRGFSGMSLSQWIHTVHTLGGRAVVIPRIQINDKRSRHIGFSHHTLTPLLAHTLVPAIIPYPDIEGDQLCEGAWSPSSYEQYQLRYSQQIAQLQDQHHVYPVPAQTLHTLILEALKWYEKPIRSMGRGYNQEPLMFQAVAAAVYWYLHNQ
ncbi:DUF3866 family protein [Caldalkalibacillus salinus]|uniref:DUF3866 family protein n=1 Tax=Caldalkalibacillus salinus TaxID=2803787 RepID=UPI001924A9CA|nr:DUF3866 family protein [Caldalkalibacillus salinus]